jgi:Flp pilus assembly protein TadG
MREGAATDRARGRTGPGKGMAKNKGRGRVARRFLQREDGTVTVFAAMIFVLMVSAGGISVDIMRFETQRAQLQYTLDRAVLAAAALSQTLEPETVVRSYFETAGFTDYRLTVQEEEGVNFRRVEAQAEMEMRTLFMSIFGQRVMTSTAAGAAEERIRNIEVSLVLDISGSMDVSPTHRIDALRPAAREFVTTLLDANDTPGGNQRVSISVVPYTDHVNMGSRLASVFALTDEHDYSRCSRFDWEDFTVSGIDPTVPIQRMGHFDILEIDAMDPVPSPYCPTDDAGAILPWSANETELHGTIDALTAWGSTAIDVGMRWGVALLDPMARPALGGLNAAGLVDDDFLGRPAAYEDETTLKIVVLMTDGSNREQLDLVERYRDGPSPFWRDPDDGDFSVYYAEWDQYWHEDHDRWRSEPDGGDNDNAVRLDYADLWNHIPVEVMRETLFHPDAWQRHEGFLSLQNWWRRPAIEAMANEYEFFDIIDIHASGEEGDRRLRRICDVAHARDIVVFTIAFDAPLEGRQVMQYCASSDAHYYDIEALNISDTFSSIARTINQLRLVQ